MAIEMVGLGAIAAYLGKDGLAKLLGPTADYLGGELKEFAQKRLENVGKIFANAAEKLPPEMQGDGAVPPKVLRNILNDGSYSSEAIGIEYFGGILASSKSNLGRDDRGARLAQKVSALTSYQLRAHFILYSALSLCFKGQDKKITTMSEDLRIFITSDSFFANMDFNESELAQINVLLPHIFNGLYGENLIGMSWVYGRAEYIREKLFDSSIDTPGVSFTPSPAGVELFLWAFGLGQKPYEYIFDVDFNAQTSGEGFSYVVYKKIKSRYI